MMSTCFTRFRVFHLEPPTPPPQRRCHLGLAKTWTLTNSQPSKLPASHCLSLPTVLAIADDLTSDAPQRSEEWFALRRDKLTTSTFSTALGFWKGNRRSELWHEKVFATDMDNISIAARSAMEWGVLSEPKAIEKYKSITGQNVGSLGFATRFGWLGASPDGIVDSFPKDGILEVKCPYNKGKPQLALPWKSMPHYYMPQIQGLMEILDREWVDLYCWTSNGSTIFRVHRDQGYWELIHGILYDFWWECVVPAREALSLGREADAMLYEPKPKHRQTGLVISRSLKLASEARVVCKEIGGYLEFFK